MDARATKHRLERSRRRIAEQHASLDVLADAVRAALARGDGERCSETLRTLAGAVEAHFELEERAYYPDPAMLEPAAASAVAAFRADHRELRARLDELTALLDAGELSPFESAYGDFSAALAEHEAAEEKTMSELSSRLSERC